MTSDINSVNAAKTSQMNTQNANADKDKKAKKDSDSESIFSKLTPEELAEEYYNMDDIKKDGKISANEWLYSLLDFDMFGTAEKHSPTLSAKIMQSFLDIFKKSDKNKDGYLNIDEFNNALNDVDKMAQKIDKKYTEKEE